MKKPTEQVEDLIRQIERYSTWKTRKEEAITLQELKKFIHSVEMVQLDEDDTDGGIERLEVQAYNRAVLTLNLRCKKMLDYIDENYKDFLSSDETGKSELKKEAVCRVCGMETSTVYNINLKATHICNKCGRSIAKQELDSMFYLSSDEKNREGEGK